MATYGSNAPKQVSAMSAACLVYGLLSLIAFFALPRDTLSQSIVFSLGHIVAGVAIFLGPRVHKPKHQLGWRTIGFGMVIYGVGNFLWQKADTFPSAADALYYVAYGLLAAGFGFLLHARTSQGGRALWLDTAIIYITTGVISYVFLIEPHLHLDLAPMELLVSIGYPIVDMLLLAGLVFLLLSEGGRGPAFWLLLAGILIQLVGDTVYSFQVLNDTFYYGAPVFATWLLAPALVAAAALHPSMRNLTMGAETTGGLRSMSRIAALGLVALLPLLVQFVSQIMGAEVPETALSAASITLVVILAARMIGLAQEARTRGAALSAANQELRAADLSLRRSAELADRANTAKSEFLSRMSHELRTPLNSILGFAQLLEMDPLQADQKESVHQIVRAGKHLLTLINEVLDISKIEAGHMSISVEPVAIGPLLRETTALVAPLATSQGIALSTEIPDDLESVYVMADSQRLKQVILNLLSNGIKYNTPGGSVSLRLRGTHEVMNVEVSDTGIGLDEAQLQDVFTPFDRLGADRTEIEGTGLGLAVSQRLAHAMGTKIEVSSEPGTGSRFSFQLSGTAAPRGEPPAGIEASIAFEERGTVLYIEDDVANLTLVDQILSRQKGITLLTAMQARFGLDLARTHHPDVILLDQNLPDLQGDEVLTMLRSDPRTATIPIIVLSADASSGQIDRFKRAGALAYLTKPLDIPEFLRTLDQALAEAVA